MRLELGDETRIGRSERNDVVLPDALASREHAILRRKNLGWIFEDLQSRHGSYINRQRVERPRSLMPNDEIMIGQSRFLFDSEFDLQNADFSDRSVYLASPNEETMEIAPVATLAGAGAGEETTEEQTAELHFVVELSNLFDSSDVGLAEVLNRACARLAPLFRADGVLLFLHDSVSNELRATVAHYANEDILVDKLIIARTRADRRAVLVSDRPDMTPHPAPGAPLPPAKRSVLCAPMEVDDSLIGILYIQRQELDAYSLVDLHNLRAVARLMAVFVDVRRRADALVLKTRFAAPESEVIGSSPAIRRVLDFVARVAPTRATVLLTGETGTGKELIAREIHRLSPRGEAGAPFVAVNCSAIPETLFESQLFGHEKGAFTGAVKLQQGLIEQANGGTLFLDEIGELSMAMQPKLLRFLQEHMFTRVGGSRTLRADVRLVCATNRDLAVEVRQGRFREDLFHRISVMPINLPPLRERPSDIALLAEHFASLHARELSVDISGINSEAMALLARYEWPGNVRELANCIERAVLLADGKVLLPRHFQIAPRISSSDEHKRLIDTETPTPNIWRSLEEIEAEHIRQVMAACGGNQVQAAEILGIHRNTLRKKLKQYKLR